MSQPYPPRFFHLRYQVGFTDEMIAGIQRGFAEWKAWVVKTLGEWESVPHRAKLPKPHYTIYDPVVSADRSVVTIRIEGDPLTHGAMMIFEDGVPQDLFFYVPRNLLSHLEVAYENQQVGKGNLSWARANISS